MSSRYYSTSVNGNRTERVCRLSFATSSSSVGMKFLFTLWVLELFLAAPFLKPTTAFVVDTLAPFRRNNARVTPVAATLSSYDATLSDHSFQELYSDYLPDWLLENCQSNDWIRPTLIQERALDVFYKQEEDEEEDSSSSSSKNSLVIQAQTGSGKTLTYLLPVLAQLEERAAIQALIVVPTRELGLQVASVAKRLVRGKKFMIMSTLQGSQLRRQRAWAWAETPHVVIGTPNELLDMIQYGGLPRINSIKYVVVDEVDACLVHKAGAAISTSSSMTTASSSGSGTTTASDTASLSSSLHELLSKHLSPTYALDTMMDDEENSIRLLSDGKKKKRRRFQQHRQTIFASATIPQHRHFLKQCKSNQWTLEEPQFCCTNPGEALPPTLEHAYMVCNRQEQKVATLRRILSKVLGGNQTNKINKKVLVFCEPSRPMEEMAQAIAHDLRGAYFDGRKKKTTDDVKDDDSSTGSVVSVLRLEDSLSQRAGATNAFSESEASSVLLTHDLAARGLDIAGITHVIQFDLPGDADTYLHRSGRAGRFGNLGQVVSILTPDQEFVLQRLANALQLSSDLKCVGRQTIKSKKKKES